MTPATLTDRAEARPGGYHDLAPSVAAEHRGALRLIDVREPDEFDGPLGHIDGAELVPLATLPAFAASLDRQAPMLLICRSGARSARAATMLAAAGFTALYNLAGGMLVWEATGLPVVRATPRA